MNIRWLLVAVLLASSSPAVAKWQYSNWGMSPGKLVAASNGRAVLSNGEPGDRMRGSDLSVGAVADYSSGKWDFKAKFYFATNQLALVKLDLSNGDGGCGALWADMKSVYGKPFSEDEDSITHSAIWHDLANNNFVSILEIGRSSCSISYKPLKSADNVGL